MEWRADRGRPEGVGTLPAERPPAATRRAGGNGGEHPPALRSMRNADMNNR